VTLQLIQSFVRYARTHRSDPRRQHVSSDPIDGKVLDEGIAAFAFEIAVISGT
jgi:hypothetical protein